MNKQYGCKKRIIAKHYKNTDKDYGVKSHKPDMDPEIYKLNIQLNLTIMNGLEFAET